MALDTDNVLGYIDLLKTLVHSIRLIKRGKINVQKYLNYEDNFLNQTQNLGKNRENLYNKNLLHLHYISII